MRVLASLFVCTLIACPVLSTATYSQANPVDSIISKESLQKTVAYLSSDSLAGRFTGSRGAASAADYIAAEFRKLGLHTMPRNNTYHNRHSFPFRKEALQIVNVIGLMVPEVPNDTMIIISAHYDHIGKGNDYFVGNSYDITDSIFNGANDNATGIAAMLELAKYIMATVKSRYIIVFAAFSGEELGMVGSGLFSQSVKKNLLKGVVNLEELGRPYGHDIYIFGKGALGIIKKFNIAARRQKPKRAYFVEDKFPQEGLYYRSDHYSFVNNAEFSVTALGTLPRDYYYHTVKDEYKTIDFRKLHAATKALAVAVADLIR